MNGDLFPETQLHPEEEPDERYTPSALYLPLHEEFRFNLDVCATPASAKCSRYFTLADNGLERSWAGARCWANIPFTVIEPWVVKAWASGADLVVMLLPSNRTEQPFWQKHIEPYRDRPQMGAAAHPSGLVLRTRFLPGRQVFGFPGNPEGVGQGSPPFGVVLCIWRRAWT